MQFTHICEDNFDGTVIKHVCSSLDEAHKSLKQLHKDATITVMDTVNQDNISIFDKAHPEVSDYFWGE